MHGATETANDSTYLLEDDAFADSFRVVRTETRVVIVNGPTEQSLSELRPGLIDTDDPPETTPDPTSTADSTSLVDGSRDDATSGTDSDDASPTTPDSGQRGLGLLVGLLALVGVTLALARRR